MYIFCRIGIGGVLLTFGEYVSSFITFEVLVKLLKTIYENQFLLNIGKDSEKEINDLFHIYRRSNF